MARNPGSANLAASLEVLAGAPLDARLVVSQKTDLTNASTYPYSYVGMVVTVTSEQKQYMLVGSDTTDPKNWVEAGGGSQTLVGLTDVDVETSTDGQVLTYNATTEKWENGDISLSVAELGDIEDVDLTSISDGQIIKWDATNSKWVNADLPSGNLEGLTDTDLSSPTDGQVLKYNATTSKWENGDISIDAEDLTDFEITTPTDGQIIAWDDTAGKWVNVDAPAGSLEGLTDTTITTPTEGQVLKYDATTDKWVNADEQSVPSDIDDLDNVEITSATDGQILKYDNATSKWINSDPESVPSDIDDLTNVEITDATDGQLLKYDAETDKWVNGDPESVPSDIDDLTNVNITTPTDGQALVYDETNQEWKNSSIGGGAGSLETAITASINVGGISSGKAYSVGTSYDNMWKDLLNPVAYPTLTNPSATLSATGAKLLETGSTLATTMTVAFNRGSISPAYGTSGYRSGAATDYALNGGTAQAGNTFSVTVDAEHTSYQATVNYEAGEQPKDSEGNNYQSALAAGSVNSNTLTYEFVDALYANTSSISTVAKLALVSKSAKTYTFNFPAQTAANPEEFHVPASWTITAVDVLNTLSNQWEDCSGEFAITDTTHNDAAGTSVAYKKYLCALGYSTGARKIRIKWS